MILDKSYFIGPLVIAQLGQKEVVDNLNAFINRFEPEVLQAALGYDLYEAFKEGIDVGSDEEIDEKWNNILNGCVFTSTCGRKRKWVGLTGGVSEGSKIAAQVSPLAAYVYSEIMRSDITQNSGVGLVKVDAENATAANPAFKFCDIVNQAARDIQILWDYLCTNQAEYSEYDKCQIDHCYFHPVNPFGI